MIFRLRVLAFLIDCIVFAILFVFINMGFILEQYIGTSIMTKSFIVVYLISLLIVLSGFILKDIIGGRSIGKRVTKIKVVKKTGLKASWPRLILRNITILIWPIEALLLLIGKERIGDFIAETKVV